MDFAFDDDNENLDLDIQNSSNNTYQHNYQNIIEDDQEYGNTTYGPLENYTEPTRTASTYIKEVSDRTMLKNYLGYFQRFGISTDLCQEREYTLTRNDISSIDALLSQVNDLIEAYQGLIYNDKEYELSKFDYEDLGSTEGNYYMLAGVEEGKPAAKCIEVIQLLTQCCLPGEDDYENPGNNFFRLNFSGDLTKLFDYTKKYINNKSVEHYNLNRCLTVLQKTSQTYEFKYPNEINDSSAFLIDENKARINKNNYFMSILPTEAAVKIPSLTVPFDDSIEIPSVRLVNKYNTVLSLQEYVTKYGSQEPLENNDDTYAEANKTFIVFPERAKISRNTGGGSNNARQTTVAVSTKNDKKESVPKITRRLFFAIPTNDTIPSYYITNSITLNDCILTDEWFNNLNSSNNSGTTSVIRGSIGLHKKFFDSLSDTLKSFEKKKEFLYAITAKKFIGENYSVSNKPIPDQKRNTDINLAGKVKMFKPCLEKSQVGKTAPYLSGTETHLDPSEYRFINGSINTNQKNPPNNITLDVTSLAKFFLNPTVTVDSKSYNTDIRSLYMNNTDTLNKYCSFLANMTMDFKIGYEQVEEKTYEADEFEKYCFQFFDKHGSSPFRDTPIKDISGEKMYLAKGIKISVSITSINVKAVMKARLMSTVTSHTGTTIPDINTVQVSNQRKIRTKSFLKPIVSSQQGTRKVRTTVDKSQVGEAEPIKKNEAIDHTVRQKNSSGLHIEVEEEEDNKNDDGNDDNDDGTE